MKKLLAFLLLFVMGMSCVACGGTKDESGKLIINVYKGGYGVEWAYDLANKFEKKSGIETVVEEFTGKNGVTAIRTDFESGSSVADLIISKDMMFDIIYRGKKTIGGVEYNNMFEDLTDLYNTKLPGENVTLKEKMDKDFADYYYVDVNKDDDVDGQYFAVPWATGMIGLIRNKDVWNKHNETAGPDDQWEIPNTTEEMFALADQILKTASKDGYKAPFIYSEDDEYWSMFSHVWVAQYMGSENMKKFYRGYNADGDRYESNIFEDKAFYSTLNILERLLKDSNNYMHDISKGTDFTNMQGSFLQGEAVFTPNGDWIQREMKSNYDTDIEFMKTPVNSALADKCSFKNEANKDEILSKTIDFIDNPEKFEKPANVTDADLAMIRDARSIEYTVGNEHFMAIPSYSNAKEEAKQFIQFMASDEGIHSYIEKTGGSLLPYEYDFSSMEATFTPFKKSTAKMIDESNLMFASKNDRLFSLGGVDMYWYNDKQWRVVPALSAENETDYRSAAWIIENNREYLQKDGRWNTILTNAGIR